MSERYEALWRKLREMGEGAFIPFVMLGDPDIGESAAILETLAQNGADALELGIPFSDPVADGPVIQVAANRAIEQGATPDRCFGIIKNFRQNHESVPIGLLVYANLVIGASAGDFYRRAAEAGADSLLIADVPTLSAATFVKRARNAGLDAVFVVPPNADDGKLREIARMTKGYTYFLGRSGVTGADREMTAPERRKIDLLKSAGAPPIVTGFGISKPEHVRVSLAAGSDGAIAGSATVSIIARCLGDRKLMHRELAAFTREMKAATKK
ncbi:MAG: tryptophan synthase subunit alpha [Synergistaceae bacterium]|jgi:tryptophan synthase alpha chain|nr:tryptophan synthase subunit alpha [Synergistaceae bacterium]